LCFISEFTYLFSGGADGNIYVWNVENYEYVNKLYGHKEAVTTLVKDKNIIFSGSADSTIIVLDNYYLGLESQEHEK
jgi:WD40 repeat protein